mmetsp:Transcript_1373/g.3215  ORF Transcript_1373/g.3215 Transcript_1373/m.3215 type:complete len:235 (+) Transcript_1373:62-766(+)
MPFDLVLRFAAPAGITSPNPHVPQFVEALLLCFREQHPLQPLSALLLRPAHHVGWVPDPRRFSCVALAIKLGREGMFPHHDHELQLAVRVPTVAHLPAPLADLLKVLVLQVRTPLLDVILGHLEKLAPHALVAVRIDVFLAVVDLVDLPVIFNLLVPGAASVKDRLRLVGLGDCVLILLHVTNFHIHNLTLVALGAEKDLVSALGARHRPPAGSSESAQAGWSCQQAQSRQGSP